MAEKLFVFDTDMIQLADKIREKTNTSDLLSWPQGYVDALNNMSGNLSGLNFEVVGGTTQPTSPLENMVWINTNIAITSWNFAPIELRPSSSQQGDVWIVTGNYHNNISFDAVKENVVYICPVKAYQYQSGSWVEVGIKVYKNNEWINNRLYVYDRGDSCTDVTGGWSKSSSSGSVQFGSESFYLKGTNFDGPASAKTNNPVDITPYSIMTVIGYVASVASEYGSVCFQSSRLISASTGSGTATWHKGGSTGNFTMNIDVSAVTGEYYVLIQVGENNACSGYIYEIYFE